MTAAISLLGALLLAFIAFKLLMGVIRIGVIILIIGVLYAMWSGGVFA